MELSAIANYVFALLAVLMFGDAILSIKPVGFIKTCIEGVGFPLNFGWGLIVVKLTATAGLIVGFYIPEIGFAAVVGLVIYFCCALTAHIRARFFKDISFGSCLTMLTIAIGSLVALVV